MAKGREAEMIAVTYLLEFLDGGRSIFLRFPSWLWFCGNDPFLGRCVGAWVSKGGRREMWEESANLGPRVWKRRRLKRRGR